MKIKIDKNLVATYMSLDNAKTNKYLVGLADQIRNEVIVSPNNDEILENMLILEKIVYKAPKETIQIISYILNKKPTPAIVHKSKIGKYEGKSHKDLLLKSIEILGHLRYIVPKKVLRLLAKFSLSEDPEIKSKSIEIVKNISKYDYNVLTKSKIGYGIQREVLDFILRWSSKKQIKHLDFIKTALHNLLGCSVEGNSMADEKTLTFHFGQVAPTDFLKKVRKETIDLIYSIYKVIPDFKEKLQLSTILEEALRQPHNTVANEDVGKMIFDDATYIAKIYREMIFDKSGKIIPENIAIAQEVEERMYWFYKSGKRTVPAMLKLRKDILEDSFYQIFYPIVGRGLPYKEEEGFDKAKENRDKEINEMVEGVNEKNVVEWQEYLNVIASQRGIIDDWKMEEFKNFLMRISSQKPELADEILSNSLKKNLPLTEYLGPFLTGFRDTMNFKMWDKYTLAIAKKKNVSLVSQICFSLSCFPKETNLNEYIRDKDLKILKDIAEKKDEFKFLVQKKKSADDRLFHYALLNALGRNFHRSPQLIGALIIKEIKQNPEYFQLYMSELSFFDKKWMDFTHISPKIKKYLIEKIVEASDFDWHLQGLALSLCNNDSGCALEILKKRIDFDVKLTKEKRKKKIFQAGSLHIGREYEPIPYHFNHNFQKSITESKSLPKIIRGWVKKMDIGWSPYNWDLSHLINRIGVSKSDLLMPIIKKGDKDDLLRVAYAIESINGVDFDLCMEIVRRTKNDRILGKISSVMYSTGVVSGEYGLSQAYEGKAEALKKYLNPEENSKQVIEFVQKMIDDFSKNAIEEKKRADEEIQLRKIEFEG